MAMVKKLVNKKKIIIVLLLLFCFGICINLTLFKSTKINKSVTSKIYESPANSAFVDQNFYNCVVDAYNEYLGTSLDYNVSLTNQQLEMIRNLDCSAISKDDSEQVVDVSGIEKLTSLEYLDLGFNELTEIDLSNNVNLTELYLYYNQITEIDLSNNTNLTTLSLDNNQLTEIDLTKNINLQTLYLYDNQISYIDLSNNINLIDLKMYSNELTEIVLTKSVNLQTLYLFDNQISDIDLSNNINLTTLWAYNNNLSEIDLDNNINLVDLRLYSNELTEIDLTKNINLQTLYLYDNQISYIDLSNNLLLETLKMGISYDCDNTYTGLGCNRSLGNNLESINLEKNVNLKRLYLSSNNLSEINLENNYLLTVLHLGSNNLTSVDLTGLENLTNLVLEDNNISELDITNNKKLVYLFAHDNSLSELNLSNNEKLKYLDLYENELTDINVDNFDELLYLNLDDNQISDINLTNNINLTGLYIRSNELSVLDLSNNTKLISLLVGSNELSFMDLSNNPNLETLRLNNNNLSEIDLTKNLNLSSLNLASNNLSEIDLTKNLKLSSLDLASNNLSEIDLSNNADLRYLNISKNKLKNIDLNNNTALGTINISYQEEKLYFYVGDEYVVDDPILLNLILSSDTTDININNNLLVFNNTFSYRYSTNDSYYLISPSGNNNHYLYYYSVYAIDITSEKYIINEDDNYIYTGNDTNPDTIISNINLTEAGEIVGVVEDNKYIIKHNDEIIKEFDIVNISSDTYDLSKEYIYSSSNVTGIFPNITVNNGNLGYDNVNKKIQIKYGDDLLQEFDYVTYSSAKYDLSGDYVRVNDTDISSFISNFDCINCSVKVYDGSNYLESGSFSDNYKLVFMHGEDVVGSYDLKYAVTGVSLNQESIRLNLDSKSTFELVASINPVNAENKNVIWTSSDESVATVDSNGVVASQSYGNVVITVTTEEGGYFDTCNVEVSDITTYTVTYSDGSNTYTEEYEEGESIVFKTDLEKVGYELVGWTYGNDDYGLSDNLVMPGSDIELVAKWELIIPEVKNYETSESYITGISLNTEISNINLGIDSIYEVRVYNHGNESKTSGLIGTGDKVKIYLDNTFVSEYEVIIKGDLTGDGQGKINDVAKLYQYLKGKITMDECYIIAGNVVNSDNIIKINDVAKLYQFIKGKIGSL